MQKQLEGIADKEVLILGFGREGRSTYRFIRKLFPQKGLGIADKRSVSEFSKEDKQIFEREGKLLELKLGDNYLEGLDKFDLIIKSPGIPNRLKELEKARKSGIKLTSATQMFLEIVQGKIIGVTGTKGKSTTASLIHHILKTNNFKCVLLGNIGKPCLDYLDKDSDETFFVFEMSSHQLSTLTTSPHIAVFLNIFEEHLDYYKSYEDYFNAKANIALYQDIDDILVYHHDFRKLRDLARKVRSQKYDYSTKTTGADCYVEGNNVTLHNEKLMWVDESPLIGMHNVQNIMAAALVGNVLGVNNTQIRSAILSFKPLEHRLESVGVVDDVEFVNDTLSTIPEAAIAALDSFKERPTTLILGGFDRGVSFSELAMYLKNANWITSVLLIGENSDRIEKTLVNAGFESKVNKPGKASMNNIVEFAHKSTPSGGVVLLSPASPSFDMFEDYEDRANQFVDAVNKLRERLRQEKSNVLK